MEESTTVLTRIGTESIERPIFVTADDRRARALRCAALTGACFASLWVVGLGIGTLNLGELPGVSLPSFARANDGGATERPTTDEDEAPKVYATPRPARARQPNAAPPLTTSGPRKAVRRAEPAELATATIVKPKLAKPTPSTRGDSATQVPPRDQTAPVPVSPTPVPTPATTGQGSLRRGWTTPPGLTRQAEVRSRPTPQPAALERAGTEPATTPAAQPTPAPAVAPSEPPGQQKKTEAPTPTG